MRLALLILLSLTACSEYPTPDDCRWAGVDVSDGDVITGTIKAEYYRPLDEVQSKCLGNSGCARAVGFKEYVFITPRGEYEIWYSDGSLRVHEACHAYYEEPRHT